MNIALNSHINTQENQMTKVLFILKRREDFNSELHTKIGLQTGLYNSANFMNNMLLSHGVDSKLVVVIDNNDIDREVTKYRPDFVFLEALWVVPSKFSVLLPLHPKVKWVIRIHSEMPFMAGEGIAMDWIGDYSLVKNVILACNAPRMLDEIHNFIKIKNSWTDEQTREKVIYLPNYYPQDYQIKQFNYDKDHIDISCFGAIRPLKNHLVQAHAALQFANNLNKKLRFHVNAGRIEMKGEPMINNLRGMFQHLAAVGHELINHLWTPREEFLELCRSMDIGMQVSFSETFNIVAADLISQGVPVVGSDEIPWLAKSWSALPTHTLSIVDKLNLTYLNPLDNVVHNQLSLTNYTNNIPPIWCKYINGE